MRRDLYKALRGGDGCNPWGQKKGGVLARLKAAAWTGEGLESGEAEPGQLSLLRPGQRAGSKEPLETARWAGKEGIGGVSAGRWRQRAGMEQQDGQGRRRAGGGVQAPLRENHTTTKLMSHVRPGVPTLCPARSPHGNPSIWKGGKALHAHAPHGPEC